MGTLPSNEPEPSFTIEELKTTAIGRRFITHQRITPSLQIG